MPNSEFSEVQNNQFVSNDIRLGQASEAMLRGSSWLDYKFIRPEDEDIVVTAGATAETEINIVSAQPYNLSKSSLDFIMWAPAEAAKYHKVHLLVPPIEKLQLTTNDGKSLVNITNFRHYWKTVAMNSISKVEYLNRTCCTSATTVAGAKAQLSECNWMNPIDVAYNTAMAANEVAGGYVALDGSLTTAIRTGYESPQAILSGALNSITAMKCSLKFSDLAGTFLSFPKLYYNQSGLKLLITWAQADKFIFTDTAVATIDTAVASVAGDVNIDNLRLNLALEPNVELGNSVRAHYASEKPITIPFIKQTNTNIGTATEKDASFVLNQANIKRLLRVYNSLFVTDEVKALSAYNGNESDILKKFRTTLNGTELQREDINFSELVNDKRIFDQLHKSTALDYYNAVYKSYSYIDALSANKDLASSEMDFMKDGHVLSGNENYLFRILSKDATACTLHTCFVGQKEIAFDSVGNLMY